MKTLLNYALGLSMMLAFSGCGIQKVTPPTLEFVDLTDIFQNGLQAKMDRVNTAHIASLKQLLRQDDDASLKKMLASSITNHQRSLDSLKINREAISANYAKLIGGKKPPRPPGGCNDGGKCDLFKFLRGKLIALPGKDYNLVLLNENGKQIGATNGEIVQISDLSTRRLFIPEQALQGNITMRLMQGKKIVFETEQVAR